MKRWVYLVALPWVVAVSSDCYKVGGIDECPKQYRAEYKGTNEHDCGSEEACQDFVDALNQAHERRTKSCECGPNCDCGYVDPNVIDRPQGPVIIRSKHPEDSER